MSLSGKAVFLSYASQDAGAALQLCTALRAAGVEVWFDQSALRGGDAWDAKIRTQIGECALFVPLISRHTQERLEGYFRLEWHLAVRRMQHMHEDAAFLLPVVIDALGEEKARVPAKFFEVQWTRLPGGESTPEFEACVAALLGGVAEPAVRHAELAAVASGAVDNTQRSTLNPERPTMPEKRNGGSPNTRNPVFGAERAGGASGAGRLLIIEDDATMLRVLKDNFEFSGYEVHTVSDGAKAVDAVLALKPDLILLDIMLPRISGFDICRRIRRDGLATPIIMLTAKSQESDVVLGLNVGADDYVAKPFSIDVLLARVQACLRRQRAPAADGFEFGDCRLDSASHKLFRCGREVTLTPKEFGLLEYFARNAGRALTRQKILDAVWGEDLIVTERSVDRCINTLRNKIEADPEHPRFIKTIRDVGYRFDVM